MKREKSNGITLVALVVTIIVLLILSGISINVLFGNGGIFNKVQNSVEKYKKAEKDELIIIEEMTNKILKNNYNDDISDETLGETAEDIVNKIKNGEDISIYVGKEVEYLTYTRADNSTTSNVWKVVYIGKNIDSNISEMNTNDNRIFLIPKFYVASIAPATSQIEINKEDNIIKVTGTDVPYSTKETFVQDMLDTKKWSYFTNNDEEAVAIGGPTVIQWNMINDWGGYSSLEVDSSDAGYTTQSLNFWWLSECDTGNDVVNNTGNLQVSNDTTWIYNWGIRPLVMLGSNAKIVVCKETAEDIVNKIKNGEDISIYVGKEVEYLTYTRADNSTTSNVWKVVYIGKNIDSNISEMNTNDNRIFLIPKFYVASIAPATSQIEINKEDNIIKVTGTDVPYSTKETFVQDMLDTKKWSYFTNNDEEAVAIGGPTLIQWNMINDWGGYSSLGVDSSDAGYTTQSLNFWWLSECDTGNDIVNNTGNLQASNDTTWTYNWGIRPLVMCGPNKDISIKYKIEQR